MTLKVLDRVTVHGKRHDLFDCFMVHMYKSDNLEWKERKERAKELYTVLGYTGSWQYCLVMGSCCVR